MLGNPYLSTEAGLGPLMRDIKTKICTDCELIALLIDDNGVELLVQNKIVCLNLPVKEVYRKLWLAEGGERNTMRIVFHGQLYWRRDAAADINLARRAHF